MSATSIEISTRNDGMLLVRVNGERAGLVHKDSDAWRIFGDPCTRYASCGDAIDALVAGRRALQEIDGVDREIGG